MEFNVKGWGWVGDIYHKVESMIQEVDDLMKEEADPIGGSVQDAGDNKNKFSFLEVQTALQQMEEVRYHMTDEKKPDRCFKNSNDAPADKSCRSGDVNGEHVLLNADQSPMTRSLVGYIDQETYEPPDVDILGECDEGNTEASKCKSILNNGPEDWIIKRNSEMTKPFKNDLDQDAGDNKNKFSFLEVQTALQQMEEVHYHMTDEKKPDRCFKNSNDAPESCQSGDVNGEHVLLNADQSPMTHSLVGYIGQEIYEPPDVDILVECDEGNTEASKCKSILNNGPEDWIIKRNSEITKPFKNDLDQKASETESAIEAANFDSTHSSMSLVFTSEIGDIDKLSASGMTRNLPNDELKDSGSSTPFLIDSPKELSFEYPTIHFKSGLSDDHVDTRNVEEAVSESFQCDDELASDIEKDLCGMLLTLIVVDDMSPSQHKIIARGSNELVPSTNLLEKDETRSYESDTSCAFFINANMETIDLEEKVVLRETSASVDVHDLFAVSERMQRFRSIKRKIMDAFALRQRTAKEYEQLGILHGDINFEHGGHVMIHTASALDNRTSIEHPYDSDWELL